MPNTAGAHGRACPTPRYAASPKANEIVERLADCSGSRAYFDHSQKAIRLTGRLRKANLTPNALAA